MTSAHVRPKSAGPEWDFRSLIETVGARLRATVRIHLARRLESGTLSEEKSGGAEGLRFKSIPVRAVYGSNPSRYNRTIANKGPKKEKSGTKHRLKTETRFFFKEHAGRRGTGRGMCRAGPCTETIRSNKHTFIREGSLVVARKVKTVADYGSNPS